VQPTPLARAGAGREFGRLVSRDGRSDLSRLPAGRLTGNVRFWHGASTHMDSESRSFHIRRSGSDGAEESVSSASALHAWAGMYRVVEHRRTRKVSANQKGIGEPERYRRPRKRPATTKATGDQETYRRPRSLSATKKPIGDQEAYRRPRSLSATYERYRRSEYILK
jgi:hypothetical protein